MNVVLFRPLAGDDDILVATLSGHSLSAAAIVTREPAQVPSWPSTWSYRIAGDVQYGPSEPFSSELDATEHAAARLCAVLECGPLDWILDRSNAAPDPAPPVVRYQFEEPTPLTPRPDPTCVVYEDQRPPSLLARLRGVWKAWRL